MVMPLQPRLLSCSDEAVLRAAEAGESQRQLSERLGVARRTIRDAIARARQAQADGEAQAREARLRAAHDQAHAVAPEPSFRQPTSEPICTAGQYFVPDGRSADVTIVNDAAIARAIWSRPPWPPYNPDAIDPADPARRIVEERFARLHRAIGALARYSYLALVRDDHFSPGQLVPHGMQDGRYVLLPYEADDGWQLYSTIDLPPLLRRVEYDAKADASWASADWRNFYAPRPTPAFRGYKAADVTIGDGYAV